MIPNSIGQERKAFHPERFQELLGQAREWISKKAASRSGEVQASLSSQQMDRRMQICVAIRASAGPCPDCFQIKSQKSKVLMLWSTTEESSPCLSK